MLILQSLEVTALDEMPCLLSLAIQEKKNCFVDSAKAHNAITAITA
jgi:hypothetical protein